VYSGVDVLTVCRYLAILEVLEAVALPATWLLAFDLSSEVFPPKDKRR